MSTTTGSLERRLSHAAQPYCNLTERAASRACPRGAGARSGRSAERRMHAKTCPCFCFHVRPDYPRTLFAHAIDALYYYHYEVPSTVIQSRLHAGAGEGWWRAGGRTGRPARVAGEGRRGDVDGVRFGRLLIHPSVP